MENEKQRESERERTYSWRVVHVAVRVYVCVDAWICVRKKMRDYAHSRDCLKERMRSGGARERERKQIAPREIESARAREKEGETERKPMVERAREGERERQIARTKRNEEEIDLTKGAPSRDERSRGALFFLKSSSLIS